MAKKTETAAPGTNAAAIDAPIPEVSPEDVKIEAGAHNRRVIVHMPKDSVTDDVRNSKIWRKVQATRPVALIKLDELLVLGFDESWYCRAIVAHATSTEAILAIEKVGSFRAISDQLYSDGTYRVHWSGSAYTIRRVSDDVIVDPIGYSTEALAVRALERLHPQKVA